MEEKISPKIIAAITTAVSAYRDAQRTMQEEEKTTVVLAPIDKVSLWAIAGRQDTMFLRRLWQMRMY